MNGLASFKRVIDWNKIDATAFYYEWAVDWNSLWQPSINFIGELIMKNTALTLLAAAAIGAISLGSASAMPFSRVSPALGQSDVENVRLVCNRYGQCYNTYRTYRSVRRYQAPHYYSGHDYYAAPAYRYPAYGYYGGPRVGIGLGPFGFGVW